MTCGDPVFNYTWLEPGKILAGSIPYFKYNLDELRSMGITNILSLTRRNFETYPDMQWNDEHVTAPIEDNGIPSPDIASFALGYIQGSYRGNRPLYVHCRGGVGRTGIILGAYYHLIRGMPLDDAIQFVRKRVNVYGYTAEAQTEPQRQWIKNVKDVLSWR